MKKYIKSSFTYAIIAMVLGVFYREYTKFSGFTGQTRLSVLHTHYFVLGMFFFLIVALLEERTNFNEQKRAKTFRILYHIGLNISGVMLFVRGMTQVMFTDNGTTLPQISCALDASISGFSGLGHAILGISIVILFLTLLKTDKVKNS